MSSTYRHTRLFLPLTLGLFMMLGTSLALAFGVLGHRSSGELASRYLLPQTEAALARILAGDSLAAATIWADEKRATEKHPFWGYDYSANWHFVNIPAGQSYQESPLHPAGDAYVALLAMITILEGEPVPQGPVRDALAQLFEDVDAPSVRAQVESMALRFLMHLVGDLHQPLHAGHEHDRGGNDIPVRWFGDSSNLHRVWDSQLLQQRALDEEALTAEYQQRFEALSTAERRTILDPRPEQWLAEALELRTQAYDLGPAPHHLGAEYVEDKLPLIEEQLLRGGLRLALLLNRIFADTDFPTP